MKKTYTKQQLKFFLVFAVFSFIQSIAYADDLKTAKKTLAVMSYADFVPDRTQAQAAQKIGLPDILAGRIIEKLINTHRFNVVERKALRRIVTGQRFGQQLQKSYLDKSMDKAINEMDKMWGGEIDAASSWSNANDLIKDFQDMGSMAGAEYLVLGNLEKVATANKSTTIPFSSNKNIYQKKTDARLRLRIIAIETGQLMGAGNVRTRVSETLFQGVNLTQAKQGTDSLTIYDEIATKASAKILDILYPATIVSHEPLIISRGTNDGVKIGDKFNIVREGKEIKDPSGIVLARLKNAVGQVEVNSVQDTISIVKLVSGQALQVGDLAQILEVDDSAVSSVASKQSKQKGPQGKQTLAMGSLRLNKAAQITKPFDVNHLKRIADEVINKLSQTQRFNLLERSEVDQILDEKTFTAITSGGDIHQSLSRLAGTDYLIHGEIVNFYLHKKSEFISLTNETLNSYTAKAEGLFRIIDVHSGRILSAEKVKITEKLNKIEDATQLVSDLIDKFSIKTVQQLLMRLYPIKVMATSSSGTVYLNRGHDAQIKSGQQYLVMRQGEALIDPDSGANFGFMEDEVAKIEVTSVDDARSKAMILSGKNPVSGDILKAIKQKKKKKKQQRVMEPNW